MSLQRANQSNQELPAANDFGDQAPEGAAMDNGFDAPAATQAATPTSVATTAAKPATAASTFGDKPKSQDTYVKFAFAEGEKEMWLKQTQIHENNIREFADTRNGFTAYSHPRDAFILVYKTADAQNYLKGFRDPDQKKGVVARIFVSHTKASTPENPKTWVGCKCDPEGLFDEAGKMKTSAKQVFGAIVGKDSADIKKLLLENNERLAAARNGAAAPKPAGNSEAPAPTQHSAPQAPQEPRPTLVADADLNFDFGT